MRGASKPKVLIDLRMVRGRLHGIARYALELAKRLPRLRPEWDFAGLVGPDPLPELGPLAPNLPLEVCAMPFLSPLEQPALAASLVKSRCDLFHATSFSLPALWPGRLVATLHDANHLALRDNYGPPWRSGGRVAYYRLVVAPRARRAEALLTVSEFSRRELARHLHIDPYRFQVIHLGVDDRFHGARAEAISGLSLPRPFALAVGNAKRHKNLGLLARIASKLPLPLVVLGGEEVRRLHFPESTVVLDRVSEHDLPSLYASAEMLLLPSVYEGFGFPALEAMAAGCPVLAARAGALPEVVGEAGWLLDERDEDAWIDAVQKLHRDAPDRKRLAELGRIRAGHFLWEDCARRTLAAYDRVLGI